MSQDSHGNALLSIESVNFSVLRIGDFFGTDPDMETGYLPLTNGSGSGFFFYFFPSFFG
jgi:hypothetical protein